MALPSQRYLRALAAVWVSAVLMHLALFGATTPGATRGLPQQGTEALTEANLRRSPYSAWAHGLWLHVDGRTVTGEGILERVATMRLVGVAVGAVSFSAGWGAGKAAAAGGPSFAARRFPTAVSSTHLPPPTVSSL